MARCPPGASVIPSTMNFDATRLLERDTGDRETERQRDRGERERLRETETETETERERLTEKGDGVKGQRGESHPS